MQINSRNKKNWEKIFEKILFKENQALYTNEIWEIAQRKYNYPYSKETARKQVIYALKDKDIALSVLKQGRQAWIH